ncbi:hypothetical protein WR25_02093 [Diploscapter pachys]|uniref:Protein arginine N-methyltransferase domain-containing protein n=1 Tax=Diploscapter pachys TaxID=2018661 RepID=A0A2A2K6R4_9BILA|nr:hypothetical protein WR25_02093 [Diploscapter pachys]
MFIQQVNKITGKVEWIVRDEDYDLTQEIARSRFADMILDFDRNDMFYEGLKTVIPEVRSRDGYVHVLDIGTGTGLLSMMAVELGADRVSALEVFDPMANCARQIVKANQVISSRSTELEQVNGGVQRPNVIVAEVFDTELIGEGALRTFRDALDNLVAPGCRVVPSTGRMWLTPIQGVFLSKFDAPPRLPGDEGSSSNEEDSPLGVVCPGSSAVFDCQISQIDPSKFACLSEPILAFDSIKFDESLSRTVKCNQSGRVDAFLVWWDLDMDRKGGNFIDMAPKWSKQALKPYQWRDHWMQAVYFPTHKNARFDAGQEMKVVCSHDEYSLWFDAVPSNENQASVERPYCICRMHAFLTRYNIYRMHALFENEQFVDFVEQNSRNQTVICPGEGSLLGLAAAKTAKKVLVVDKNTHFREILEKYKQYYQLLNIDIYESVEKLPVEIGDSSELTVLAEPFYLTAMNPIDHLRYIHEVKMIREKYKNSNIIAYPREATLRMLPVAFTHLHNIAAPVGTVHGFDLSAFDELSYVSRLVLIMRKF